MAPGMIKAEHISTQPRDISKQTLIDNREKAENLSDMPEMVSSKKE